MRVVRVLPTSAVLALLLVLATAVAAPAQETPALIVAGGPAAVTDTVVADLEAATGSTSARLAGPNRFATAAAVADAFPVGAPAYVAWGGGAADALAGGPAAARDGGPILLTETDRLPAETVTALERLAPSGITVLGGTAVVSPAVEAALAELTDGAVTRLAGPDRYATAAAVAGTFAAPVAEVFVASGESFADALSAAQAAGLAGVPVLLTATHELPAATMQALQDLDPATVTVVGGPAAVADSVVLQLEDLTGVPVTRLAGDTRFTTALAVAFATYPEGADRVYLADGGDFPDALAVSPLAAGATGAPTFAGGTPDGDGPLVLVDDPLADEVRDGVVELLGVAIDPAEDNTAPTAVDQEVDVTASGSVEVTLLGEDPDGDPLTFAIAEPPARGDVVLDGDVATYTALGGGYTETFTFVADDGQATSLPATVTVTVASSPPPNRAPEVDLDPADPATVDVDAGTAVEDAAPLDLAATATVDDPDGARLAGLTATLDPILDAGLETLAADTTGTGLTATWDAGTGVLALTPTAPDTTVPEADVATVLQTLTYVHTGQDPTDGPRTVVVVATDDDGAASAPATATLTVQGVNDAPVIVGPAPLTVDEDTPLAVTGVSVSDVDGAQVEVTVGVTDGTLTTVPAGVGDGTATTVLTGALPDVDAALATLTFTPTADASGPVTLTATADDLGSTGTGGALTDSVTVDITVLPVNDAPGVTVPASASTDEDTALVITGVSVADVDAGGAAVDLELAVTAGTLSAASGGGVTVTGSGSATATLTGALADLNAFITAGNVSLQPPADDDTSLTLTATADDLGATGSGGALSDAASVVVDLLPVNDPPVVTTSGGDTAFTEDAGPVAVDAALTVTDIDSAQLTGATVAITAGHVVADDVLAADTTGTAITAGYDTGTGVLTLSGAADLADYQAVLQAVTFDNASDDPTPATRTITVQVDDGAAPSTTATKGIALNGVNDPPVVTTTGTALALTEGDPATALDPGLTVTDVDDTDLDGATVSITSGRDTGDVLGFTDQNGITGTFTPGTGVLSLSGTATLADYQAALRSITFSGTSDTPTTDKVVTYVADDGTASSTAATRAITVTPVDDPPTVTTSAGDAAFTEGGGPVVVDGGLTVTDVDSAQLTGATVAITAGHDVTDDVVAVSDALGITGSWDAPSGVLTLSGAADVADYQAVLRTVTFDHTGDAPTATRTITVTVADATSTSAGATKDVALTGVNDAPVVTTSSTPLALDEGDPATAVDDALTVADADDTDLEGATISLSTGFDAGDVLGFTDQNGITGTYAAGTGVLTLAGTASVADYQAALRSITFSGTDTSPTTDKVVTFVADDGTADSAAATRSLTVTDLNDAPIGIDDTFTAIGNTALSVGTTRPTGQAGHVLTGSLLTNDTDAENDPLFAEAVTDAPTTLGGTVTIADDGTFTYHPDGGDTGVTDSFTYRVCDTDPCSSAVPNDRATLRLELLQQVWYVDNTAPAGGDGTSDGAFDTFAAAEAASGAGDTLYVHVGTGDATGLGGGVALGTGERLLGEAAGLTLDPDGGGPHPLATLHPAAANAHPLLTATDADVVALATGAEVRGVRLDPGGNGGGIAGGVGVAGATIDDVRIIDEGAVGQQPGLELASTSGTFTVNDLEVSTTITGPPGRIGIRLVDAGTVNLTGQVDVTTDGAAALSAAGTSLGTSAVASATVTGSPAGGIALTSTTGSITFTDLALGTTGPTAAFSATSAGTVTVPAGGTATVDAVGGPALVVDSTTIGAGDLTFDRLSSSGATNGIRLTSTGTSGRLVVEGTPDDTPDGSGGLITTTGGHGIDLQGTLAPTLVDVDVSGAGDAAGEHAVRVHEVSGTGRLAEMRLTDPADDGIVVTNATTTMSLAVEHSTLTHTAAVGPTADDGIVIEPTTSATTTLTVEDTTFTDLVGHAVRSVPTSPNLTTLTVRDSTSTVTSAGRVGGITINGQQQARTALTLDDVDLTGAGGAGAISVDANDDSTITGTISDGAVADAPAIGILLQVDEGATATLEVSNTTVTGSGGDGIEAVNFGGFGSSTLDLRLTDNTVAGHSLDPNQAFIGGIVVFGFEDALDLLLTGNTVTGTPGGGACGGLACVDVHLEEAGGTFRMEEVPDTPTINADPAYVTSVNPGVTDVVVAGTIPLSNGTPITGP